MAQFSDDKNPSPTSWKGAALGRFSEALQEGGNQQLITKKLMSLKKELLEIQAFEKYDRRNLLRIPQKRNYQTISILCGHKRSVTSVHALPDGRIISGSDDKTIRIWSKTTLEAEVLRGHSGSVLCIQGLPGNRIISGSGDGTIRMWTNESSSEWQNHVLYQSEFSQITSLQALPSGEIIAGGSSGRLWIGSMYGNLNWKFVEIGKHGDRINCIHALSHECVICGSRDRYIKRWTKNKTGEWTSENLTEHLNSVYCVQVLSSTEIVSSSQDQTIRYWKRGKDKEWRSTRFVDDWSSWTESFQVLLDGQMMVSGRGNELKINKKTADGDWKSETLTAHEDNIKSLQVLPDGTIITAGDKTIRIWDGEEVR